MRRVVQLGLILAFVLLVVACSERTTPTPDQTVGTPEERASLSILPNVLVQAEGEIWLRREGWSDFVPVGFGGTVDTGDLLRVAEGGAVAVFCGDDLMWDSGPLQLPADGIEHGIPCETGRPPRPWPDVAALRGERIGDIPYILLPRDTALLSARPPLHWHEVTGVGDYLVSVLADDGQDRPQVQVAGNRTEWPEDWPSLEPGATYVLVVEGAGQLSDEGNEGHAGLGFWLLPAEQVEVVQGLEARLRAQPLSPTAADLLVAELYRSHGLRAEAAALLEELVLTDGAPSVWIALGEVYLEIGLALEAEEALEQALASAQAAGQQEAEATARVGLALTARLQDDDASAQEHLLAARALYEQIGDRVRLEEVDHLLGE